MYAIVSGRDAVEEIITVGIRGNSRQYVCPGAIKQVHNHIGDPGFSAILGTIIVSSCTGAVIKPDPVAQTHEFNKTKIYCEIAAIILDTAVSINQRHVFFIIITASFKRFTRGDQGHDSAADAVGARIGIIQAIVIDIHVVIRTCLGRPAAGNICQRPPAGKIVLTNLDDIFAFRNVIEEIIPIPVCRHRINRRSRQRVLIRPEQFHHNAAKPGFPVIHNPVAVRIAPDAVAQRDGSEKSKIHCQIAVIIIDTAVALRTEICFSSRFAVEIKING